jgi:glutamine amidotransferase
MSARSVAIIPCSGSNYHSVLAAAAYHHVPSQVTVDPEQIRRASHVILPGVGAAEFAMGQIQDLGLAEVIRELKQPVLGICLGMQLLGKTSDEGKVPCLNLIPLSVHRLTQAPLLPHMGWNNMSFRLPIDPLLAGCDEQSDFYFVHSYGMATHPEWTIATCNYGCDFSAAVRYKNFWGTQFHPEKSGALGYRVLGQFFAQSGRD